WGEGNLERAREDFEQAIRYDGSLKDAHLSLYYLLVECGEYEEALKKYRQNLVLDSALALLPPSFEIQSILGQTNVGISYCATETGRDKPVAVTVLRRSSGFPAETLNEIVEELKCIHSPYISPFLGLDRYNGRTYIVTEFIPGDILRKRIGGGQQMPLPEAMQIANQVAQALEAGALCGVPHRNLEPDNIVLKSPEAAVLVNFGFSRLERLPGSKLLTTTRSDYTSPEQRAGNPGDTRSDIYALGTILFEMLTGWLPGVSTAKQVSEVNPTVSEAMDILIAHAREIDPASRFQTVADMRRELQRIMLSSRQGWPGQYLRLALARTSALYTSLFSRQGLPVILAIVLFFLAAEGINQAFLVSLRGATRLILLLLIDSLAASAIGYYIVREVARQKGLGSLIFSGRGLGASFGWAFTLFLVRTTDFRGVRFGDIGRGDFAGYVFLNLAVTILMTYIAISLIRAAASLTEKWQRRYPLGFYWGYVFLFALVLLLALLRFPFGIFKF
ncbi:MAG: protein kinase domain-containing protein, partial [Omnitrophica WOR_2 bacterium]